MRGGADTAFGAEVKTRRMKEGNVEMKNMKITKCPEYHLTTST